MFYFSTEDYLSGVFRTPQQAHESAKKVFTGVQPLQQNSYGCYYFSCNEGIIDICDDENGDD